MTTPWFEPNTFGGFYGAIAGGGFGVLMGVFGGLVGGVLVPRCLGRSGVLVGMVALVVLGFAQLVFGLCALAAGQPFGIWFGPTLCGVIFVVVVGGLIPVIRRAYTLAEQRRLEADAIRRS